LSRALRIVVDVACLALLFVPWFSTAEARLGPLITLWFASNLALPRPVVLDPLRRHSLASVVLVLLGDWIFFNLFSSASFGMGSATLYSARNVFQGLLFVLTGASNLLAVKAYPERKTTVPSLCCGALASVAGVLWVWLAMHAPGTS
jgi:hypothetical protein